MDVFSKAAQFNGNVSIIKRDTGPTRTFRTVQMLDGRVRNFPEHQIPARDPYEITNIWRYPAQGQYSNVLINGGQVQFRINEGTGSGDIEKCRLRMVVQNTSGSLDAEYIPAPLWLKTNNWQTPNGELIQQCDGTVLWLSTIGAHDSDKWKYAGELQLSNDDYGLGEPLGIGESRELEIELNGNWLETANMFIPWIKGDLYWYPTFYADSVIRLGGGQLTVTDMSLDMYMSNTDTATLNQRASLIKTTPIDLVVPYVRNQTFTMALQANSQYSLLLNGLTGDVVFAWIMIRNSYIGTDLMDGWPLASFQFQDSGGNPISSNNLITDEMDRNIFYPRSFLGKGAHLNNIYFWSFSHNPTAPLSLILNGLKTGQYPFTGNEKLLLNTPNAGRNEVITLTFTAPATQTGAGQTPASPQLTSGGFFFMFSTADGQEKSIFIQPSFTNAQVVAAIENMVLFSGTVTVTGFPLAFTGTASGIGNGGITAVATITYGGGYALSPMAKDGNLLYCQPAALQLELLNGATDYMVPVVIDEETTQEGAWGIANGNTYVIDIYAYTTGMVNINTRGEPKVMYSA